MENTVHPPFIDATILQAGNLDATAAVYRAIGLPLEHEEHEDGPRHLACDIGGAHFAIYEAEADGSAGNRRDAGATMVGFRVDDLEARLAAALAAGAQLEQAIEQAPWGARAVIRDPDGRFVELNSGAEGAGLPLV